jgi:hypothetical protein
MEWYFVLSAASAAPERTQVFFVGQDWGLLASCRDGIEWWYLLVACCCVVQTLVPCCAICKAPFQIAMRYHTVSVAGDLQCYFVGDCRACNCYAAFLQLCGRDWRRIYQASFRLAVAMWGTLLCMANVRGSLGGKATV